MGADVTIIGRNTMFLPQEEPGISRLAKLELGKHIKVLTNRAVVTVEKSDGMKRLVTQDRDRKSEMTVEAESILVATGRG